MNRADQRTSIGGAFSVSAKMEIRQHLKLPTPYVPNLSREGKMCGEAHLGRGNDGISQQINLWCLFIVSITIGLIVMVSAVFIHTPP